MKLRRAVDGESIKTELSCAAEEEKVEETSSEDGSDICLKNIDISDSQLKLDVDDDLLRPEQSATFWSNQRRSSKIYNDDGIEKFFDLAYAKELRPIKSMKEILQTDTLKLRYYGIDPRIIPVIVEAIDQNTLIQIIDLTENWLTADACEHLNQLLLTKEIISQLNLRGCRIGAEGVKNLQNGIATAPALSDLNLSRCEIGDEGLELIASPIYLNNNLENVNLADNKLEEKGADYLSAMVAQTESLKSLDLSHNHLGHSIFAETFFQGLTKNKTLEYLNMSENGLGSETTPALAYFIAKSKKLRELDLSGNRFTESDANQIAAALSSNKCLEVLRLGNNPLGASGALELVNAVSPYKSPNLKLELLDMGNVWAEKEILPSLEMLKNEKPSLTIKLGGILSNYKLRGPDTQKIFLRRAHHEALNPKKKKLKKDFGHLMLSLNDEVITSDFFKKSIKKFKLKLSQSLVNEIITAFEIEMGQIDLATMKKRYLEEFPDTKLPPQESRQKDTSDA
ncbi:leucine-rich repeat-containing protein 74B-like [Venturia canescens]|uniref:leucine-rich repeat-containing protein 74B-like n=1 Tax=Venturia canescens TaxID=32260 RepID=UPI001C9C2C79|nr:leucine-rich repeat-containing protein 74B-like [Venturia canescens]